MLTLTVLELTLRSLAIASTPPLTQTRPLLSVCGHLSSLRRTAVFVDIAPHE